MDHMHYPVIEFGPVMKGLVIGGLGIVHVFLAQFAIGGGFLMCYLQHLAHTGRSVAARKLLDSYFKFLVMISFVLGALTGVGMWFMSIQISPATIGLMIDEFHWIWAIEWTFFCVEIVAGYAFYRYGAYLSDRNRMALLVFYTAAAWFSLFWINGILSWQLTPGQWPGESNVWAAFFNASFYPSLLYRTMVALTIAALAGCVVINTLQIAREHREDLLRRCSILLAPMMGMPVVGVWYLMVIPADSRSWMLGGSVAMTLFLSIAIGASLLIGAYAAIGLLHQRLYINGATATLLLGLALIATAGGEFVREGSRKPYTVRGYLYSNSLKKNDIHALRTSGSLINDPYPVRHENSYPNDQLIMGRKVYRMQCSICHTLSGTNGLTHLLGTWSAEQKRMNIAKLQHTKPFMPPFAGNAEELEALVQFLDWHLADRPSSWQLGNDPLQLQQIRKWLELSAESSAEQATTPGTPEAP